MPFVAVPNAVEVRLNFSIAAVEDMVNVLHYRNVGDVDIDATVAAGLATAVGGAWAADLAAVISDDVVLQTISVKDISAVDQPSFVFSDGTAGGDAAAILPFTTALVTTLRTASGSRGGRGRIYWGGYTESSNDGADSANAAARTATQDTMLGLSLLNNIGGNPAADFNLGVVSRFAHVGGDPLGAPVAPIIRDVVSYQTGARWDNQRRRHNKLRI